MQNSAEMYQRAYNLGLQEAGLAIAMPRFLLICIAPLIVYILNKYGKRCLFFIFGFAFLMASFYLFYHTPATVGGEKNYLSLIPMVSISIGEAFILLVAYAGFPYLVPERYFIMTYSLLMALSNLAIVLSTFIVGKVLDASHIVRVEFSSVYLTLLVFSAFGLACSIYLNYHDDKIRGILNAIIVSDDDTCISETDFSSAYETELKSFTTKDNLTLRVQSN